MLDEFYKTWVFDCDGVLLDSNKVKSNAFYKVALSYGKTSAEEFVKYHKQHGGVSRFKKMEAFWLDILGRPRDDDQIDKLIEQFGQICRNDLKLCDETPMVREFLGTISDKKRIVVSGGEEKELRKLFKTIDLDQYFDDICGSPRSKIKILESLNIEMPGIFVGDSECDYMAAKYVGLDFIFMTQFTEFTGWKNYFHQKPVRIIYNFGDLYDTLS